MGKIKSIIAREIKDSRGNPTIEVELETEKKSFIASVPSGASTGEKEAVEMRDLDGKGVSIAIKNINDVIFSKLKGKDVINQQELDKLMIDLDGTENKSKLGANAILGVSMAICRAGAFAKKVSLYKHISELAGNSTEDGILQKMPLAMFNILNGGKHVPQHRNSDGGEVKPHLDIQEFMVVPQKSTFIENLFLCNKIFNNLEKSIKENYKDKEISLGDEGGVDVPISKTEQALYLLKNAIGSEKAEISLDCAGSEFFENDRYVLEEKSLTKSELLEFYKDLVERFPIISIEDPFTQKDWNGFELIMKEMGEKITIVGDDLTTTNIKSIKEAHNKNACNGVILKLNQIGTVSETIEASNLAKSFGWKTIVSHRSGETMDDFIADLSVGTGADFIKSGSPAKEERMVKYKRLIEIEKDF